MFWLTVFSNEFLLCMDVQEGRGTNEDEHTIESRGTDDLGQIDLILLFKYV